MTTIAIKDGVVAADTQACGNYINPYAVRKIKKIKARLHGFLDQDVIVGGSGDLTEVHQFMDWVENDGRKENYIIPSESDLFIVNSEGIWAFNKYYKPSFIGKIGAIGSGGRYAIGAMYAGANARLAVSIASELDPDTGGEIVELRLGE